MKYCDNIAHTLVFDSESIFPCSVCTNGKIPQYYNIVDNPETFDFQIDQNQNFALINSDMLQNYSCANCIFLKEVEGLTELENKITLIDLKFWNEFEAYDPFIIIKKLYEQNKIDSENLVIRIQGDEIFLFKNIDKYIDLFEEYGFKNIHFSTSNIIYQPSIERILKNGKGSLNVCLDSGTKETYEKVKGSNDFDVVVENLKKYLRNVSENHLITVHYYFMRGINENKKEIDSFFNLMGEIGIVNVGVRINHEDLNFYLSGVISKKKSMSYQKLINYFYEKARIENYILDNDSCIEQNFVLKNEKDKNNSVFDFFKNIFK